METEENLAGQVGVWGEIDGRGGEWRYVLVERIGSKKQ
jgi:hypothetical protein